MYSIELRNIVSEFKKEYGDTGILTTYLYYRDWYSSKPEILFNLYTLDNRFISGLVSVPAQDILERLSSNWILNDIRYEIIITGDPDELRRDITTRLAHLRLADYKDIRVTLCESKW